MIYLNNIWPWSYFPSLGPILFSIKSWKWTGSLVFKLVFVMCWWFHMWWDQWEGDEKEGSAWLVGLGPSFLPLLPPLLLHSSLLIKVLVLQKTLYLWENLETTCPKSFGNSQKYLVERTWPDNCGESHWNKVLLIFRRETTETPFSCGFFQPSILRYCCFSGILRMYIYNMLKIL